MAPITRRKNGVARRLTVRQPIPKDVLIELNLKHNKECMFCGRKEISEKLYGALYQLNDVVVHYFCILLSSRAVQNGADKEGIWGFLLEDIKAELSRGAREECYYCKEKGATIGCCETKCRKVFHLPCGIDNGSMHQYFQSFKSFCFRHRVTQAIDIQELQNSQPVQCAICKDDVIPTPSQSTLWAPCCKRAAWFHRGCVQDMALSAGYFFKCPLCNNTDTFKARMLTLGIYIPSRDASWETVPNAYAELLERHNVCDAVKCLCPHYDHRKFNQHTGSWEIVLCHACGSSGTHQLCSSLKCGQNWFCAACCKITDGSVGPKRRRTAITSTVVRSSISTEVVPEVESPNIDSIVNNVREVSRNAATRETARLHNSNKNTIGQDESELNLATSEEIDNTIVISDDDDDDDDSNNANSSNKGSDADSDVQVISYIDPPNMALITSQNGGLPVIQSFSSINTSTSVINGFHQRTFSAMHQLTNYNNLSLPGNIDLTLDDDDDDDDDSSS